MSYGNENKKDKIPLIRTEGLLLIQNTPKGRGVFAGRDILGRTVLEVAPVLVLDPLENEEHIKKTVLYHYSYNWPFRPTEKQLAQYNGAKPPSVTQAIILGLGSMFNHSQMNQNVGWERDIDNLIITYTTLRDIKAGEELCISYGQRLTFTDADEEPPAKLANGEDDWTDMMDIIDLID